MAVVFSKVMTAFLATPAITELFDAIRRKRVNVLLEKRFPLLAAAVDDNMEHGPIGDGRAGMRRQANYTVIVANRLAGGKHQDEAIEELTSVLEAEAVAFGYDQDGYVAEVEVGAWAADETEGDTQGDKVWVEVPIVVSFQPK